jgi:hypothetical protein
MSGLRTSGASRHTIPSMVLADGVSGTPKPRLNRPRGKGQQKITVEHVHVRGQAVVGVVGTPGGGVQPEVGVGEDIHRG